MNNLNSQRVKTNYETISNYLSYLCRAMLVREVSRFDIRGKGVLSGSKKYYLNDISFKNYLTSGFEPGLGGVMENMLFNHLKARGDALYAGTWYDFEIDFIAEREKSQRAYYQVCYSLADSGTAEREYATLLKIKDNYEKCVISMDDTSFGSKDGIHHKLIWELCGAA